MKYKHTAKVLSRVPKGVEAVMYLTEKIRVLNTLHSGMTYSVVGHEFNINPSTSYIN